MLKRFICVVICLNFKMKLDNLYYLKYSHYCLHLYCQIPNFPADSSLGVFQVYHVELGNTHRIFCPVSWGYRIH